MVSALLYWIMSDKLVFSIDCHDDLFVGKDMEQIQSPLLFGQGRLSVWIFHLKRKLIFFLN
jgi:hypothetical protein